MYIEDDSTLYLTTYINAHNNDQRCLIENDNHIIFTGDQYHDKIIEKIEGFLIGVQFTDTYSIKHREIVIHAEDKMFDICGFEVE